jgi:N-hydroxyarylamine O-acetyltransferase
MYNARVTVRDAEGHAEKRGLVTESEFRGVLPGEFALNMSDQQIMRVSRLREQKGQGTLRTHFRFPSGQREQ